MSIYCILFRAFLFLPSSSYFSSKFWFSNLLHPMVWIASGAPLFIVSNPHCISFILFLVVKLICVCSLSYARLFFLFRLAETFTRNFELRLKHSIPLRFNSVCLYATRGVAVVCRLGIPKYEIERQPEAKRIKEEKTQLLPVVEMLHMLR